MRLTAPVMWHRHPHALRVSVVALLAVLTALAGTLLYENEYDPWAIVGVVIAFALVSARILDPPGRRH